MYIYIYTHLYIFLLYVHNTHVYIILYYIILYYIILYYNCYIILSYIILYYVILYNITLYYIILYYIIYTHIIHISSYYFIFNMQMVIPLPSSVLFGDNSHFRVAEISPAGWAIEISPVAYSMQQLTFTAMCL